MKKLCFFLLLSVFFFSCSGGDRIESVGSKTKVVIERSVAGASDPGIQLSCNSAVLNYDARAITLEGLDYIGSWGGLSWVTPVKVKDNQLIVEIPSDTTYYVLIGNQRHILTPVAGKK